MKKVYPHQNEEHMAKMREKLNKKKELASANTQATSGEAINNQPPKFKIKSPRDIKKAIKVIASDIINKEGKYTVAEAKMLKDLMLLFFKADEYEKVLKEYKDIKAREREAQGMM